MNQFIEVALPLVAINVASAREKSIWHGAQALMAIVKLLDVGGHQVRYVRKPFGRGSDFGVTSVNDGLGQLLSKAEVPR
ncbi:MAG: hypothetical protein ABIV92_02795 [Thermoflexales bacterium]